MGSGAADPNPVSRPPASGVVGSNRKTGLEMKYPNPLVSEVIQNLRAAITRLEAAEYRWEEAIEGFPNIAETSQLAGLLHAASHETGSVLGMWVQDIEALLARIEVRERFSIFSPSQFEAIVARGWSTGLIKELSPHFPELGLPKLSAEVKRLCAAWSALQTVQHSHGP